MANTEVKLDFDKKVGKPTGPKVTGSDPDDLDINLSVGDTLVFVCDDEDFTVTISPKDHECPFCTQAVKRGPKKNLFTGKDNEDFKDDSKGKKKVSCGAVHSHFGPGELPCAYKYTATANSGKKIDPHIIVA